MSIDCFIWYFYWETMIDWYYYTLCISFIFYNLFYLKLFLKYLLNKLRNETDEVIRRIATHSNSFPTPMAPPILVVRVSTLTCQLVTFISRTLLKSMTIPPWLKSLVLIRPWYTTLYLKLVNTQIGRKRQTYAKLYLIKLHGLRQFPLGNFPSKIWSK